MHLSSPIPAFLVIVHDGKTIKTADTLFGKPALEAYKQRATDAGYQLWIKSLDDVVRECSAFEPMREALAEVTHGYESLNNEPQNRSKLASVWIDRSRQALSLATSQPA